FCPTTTRPTCCRRLGIHWPSSRTSCVISCVDFIRSGQTRLVARMFDQTETNRPPFPYLPAPSNCGLAASLLTTWTQSYDDRQAGIGFCLANASFEIPLIHFIDQIGIIYKQDEFQRWKGLFSKRRFRNRPFGRVAAFVEATAPEETTAPWLRGVIEFEPSALHHRRRVGFKCLAQQAIEDARADALTRCI